MEELLKKIVRCLNFTFFGSLIVLLPLGFLVSKDILSSSWQLPEKYAFTMQVIGILLFLGGVPLSLFRYSKKSKKLLAEEDVEKRLLCYRKIALCRILILTTLGIVALLLDLFTPMNEARTLYIMVMLFFAFCIPGKNQVIREMKLYPELVEEKSVKEEDFENENKLQEEDDDDFIPKNSKRNDEA